jgi:glycosyltransferase involved in cell wall biosynthesis
MERHRLAVLIPALNEAATIREVVVNAAKYGTPLVVDDGSIDRTSEEASGAGAIVCTLAVNRGYDGALNAGFEQAAKLGFDYVITVDADGQHDPESIKSMIEALELGADLVLGVRDKRQRFAERVFAFGTYLRWRIKDPLCGMKGYRIQIYKQLGHFDSYQSVGTELALFAARRKVKIAEVPVRTRERKGAPRFGSLVSANLRILRAFARGML